MHTNSAAFPIIRRLLRVVSLLVIGSLLSACTPLKFVVFMALGELRGPFHNTTTVADLTGNGFQDVVLVNTRQESEIDLLEQCHLLVQRRRWALSPPPPLSCRLTTTSPRLPATWTATAILDLLYLAAVQLMPFRNMGGEQGGEPGRAGRRAGRAHLRRPRHAWLAPFG
jgi:hypothetical protein